MISGDCAGYDCCCCAAIGAALVMPAISAAFATIVLFQSTIKIALSTVALALVTINIARNWI